VVIADSSKPWSAAKASMVWLLCVGGCIKNMPGCLHDRHGAAEPPLIFDLWRHHRPGYGHTDIISICSRAVGRHARAIST
jgi:hypothetical protein